MRHRQVVESLATRPASDAYAEYLAAEYDRGEVDHIELIDLLRMLQMVSADLRP